MKPEELAEESSERDALTALLGTLERRDRVIVALRFGLYDGEPWPLSKVGKEIGVCRERVRQLQLAAIEKLQRAARTSLGSFWHAKPAQQSLLRLLAAKPDARAKAWRATVARESQALRKAAV